MVPVLKQATSLRQEHAERKVDVILQDGEHHTYNLDEAADSELLAERFRLQFRGELFNAFNHANFGIPGTALGSPNFGTITTAAAARVTQLGLKLYF